MEHDGIDLSNIVWYEGPRDPEPCAICACDTRATRVKRAWFCGCVFDEEGDLVVECDCSATQLLICGPCLHDSCESVWG
jgi:hypothetical protein